MGGSDKTKPDESDSGHSDSVRDMTAIQSGTGTGLSSGSGSKSYTTSSASGIYDVSRMNIRAQNAHDANGTSLSQTGSAGVSYAKRVRAKSALLRGLAVAVLLPLIGGGVYLFTTDKYVANHSTEKVMPVPIEAMSEPVDVDRKPVIREALPKPAPIDGVALTDGTTSTALEIQKGQHTEIPQPVVESKPLILVFNYNGDLVSPFSAELDENGVEVSRIEPAQHFAFLPMGAFEDAKTIASVQPPANFITQGSSRPFAFTEIERRRIIQLRQSAIEIQTAVISSERVAQSRAGKEPVAVKSLAGSSESVEALEELQWLRAASFARDISSDVSGHVLIEKRLLETLKIWAKTYRPSGSALAEVPLLDALYAYDQVRHLWSTLDQVQIDGFFKDLVEAQFSKIKLEKTYSLEHAAHVRFALAVAYVTGSAPMQFYAQEQFKNHVQNSPLGTMGSLGHNEVLTVGHLLHAAFVLERSNSMIYRNAKLNRAVDVLVTASQTTRSRLLETMAVAAYFRQDLYAGLRAAALAAGVSGSRFGTNEGALLAAIRKPTSILGTASGLERMPSAVPLKLPPKSTRK